MDSSELTERFVRGDASRNTEGSGLGLAIAKSFMELQGGRDSTFFPDYPLKAIPHILCPFLPKTIQKHDTSETWGTRVYVNGFRIGDTVIITLKNISAQEITVDSSELTPG